MGAWSHNEIEWHYDEDNIDDSFVKVDTENVHVLAGAIDSNHVEIHHFSGGVLNGGSIEVDPPLADSALIAMILIETDDTSSTYLIIATGKMENTGQSIISAPSPPNPPPPEPPVWWQVDTWVQSPFRVLVEGIRARITLPVPAGNVDFYSLNADGSEHTELEPEPLGAQCRLHLSPDYETLWYKLVITS
jgi:hypothetical protein